MLRSILLMLALLGSPALAVEPSEMLDDPMLEARARALSAKLRCLVCQNESIDESNAPLAQDLRRHVRMMLLDGHTDQEILDDVAYRYGEFALMMPRPKGTTWLLYLSVPALLLIGLWLAMTQLRRRAPRQSDPELSASEQQRIDSLTKDVDHPRHRS